MSSPSLSLSTEAKLPWFTRMARRLVLNGLAGLEQGRLTIVEKGLGGEPSQALTFGEQEPSDRSLQGTLVVNDPDMYKDILFNGSVGAAESYMSGDWETEDLTALVRVLVRNMSTLDQMETGIATLSKPARALFHWYNKNSQKGSKRNIAAHYDLSNDLFKLFLDPTMMYSSGIYPSADASLEEASLYKLDRICQKLELKPSDHLVEVGTGWGGMAIYAAQNYGCKVTTTTISQQQYDLAKERVIAAGLEDKIEILLEDYRKLEGKYDKLVSIEMIEAVGWQFYEEYFAKCASLLKPDGLMLIQAITIEDQRYESARKNVDFIQRYIFPGSCIPSITALQNASTKASDLRIVGLEDITPHYARTLHDWCVNFKAKLAEVRELGFNDEFIRMWEFYLCYCEGGFEERAIGDVHILFMKPGNRSDFATLPA